MSQSNIPPLLQAPSSQPTAAQPPHSPAQMAQQQIELADIHLPQPVSDWPPAIGWWVIAALALLLMVTAFVWLMQRLSLQKMARRALTHLKEQGETLDLQALNEMLKITAMHYAEDSKLAGLTGSRWHQWLEQYSPAKQAPATARITQLLKEQQYRNTELTAAQRAQLMADAKSWFSHCWKIKRRVKQQRKAEEALS